MLRGLTRKPPPIGLDIGADVVRLLQVDALGGAVSATAAAFRTLPPAAIGDPPVRREHVVTAIRDMLASGAFRGRRVVTCLGDGTLRVKQARLPRLNDAERDSAILWEASERFDFDVKPELLHHLVAGDVRSANEIQQEVILLGAAEDTVEAHVAMLSQVGLYPVAVDAEPICAFRAFERFLRRDCDTEVVSVLVDIRGANTWVLFARGRRIGFIKSVDVGTHHFTQAIAKQLNLEYTEAVEVRRHQGTLSMSENPEQIRQAVRDALRPVAEELAREINLCLRYCAVTFRGSRPDRVTLVGEAAADAHVRELICESINLDCETGRPFKGIDSSQVALGSDQRGPLCEWSVATGLALRELIIKDTGQEDGDEPDRLSA
ncbi:MAG: pilus assembly protein PilM [Planctomycetota bacterium]